ncbi:hypothetical protein BJ878DRAFT_426044, partial [Calycina marina]
SAPAGKATLIYSHALENVPGKSLVGIHVEFPGGAETPPHTHAGPSLVAVVLEGQVFNKIEGGELVVLKAGDSFFEHPGAHNFNITGRAGLLTTLVVDTEIAENGVNALTVIDEGYILGSYKELRFAYVGVN